MTDITMHPIEGSSNINAVGYRENELRILYKNGGLYAYDGVRPTQFQDLMECYGNGDSVGKYVKQHIQPHHSFRKIEETE